MRACPLCKKSARQEVKDTRPGDNGTTFRKRRCELCRGVYETIERLSEKRLWVIKNNDSIVPFNKETIRRSLSEAAVRKYDPDKIQDLIYNVIADVYPRGGADGKDTVRSSEIADAILPRFESIDNVSHIRFALVHLGRTDRPTEKGWSYASDFLKWLNERYKDLPQSQISREPSGVVKRRTSYVDQQLKRPIAGSYSSRNKIESVSDEEISDLVLTPKPVESYDKEKLRSGIKIAAKGRGGAEHITNLVNKVVDEVEKVLFNQPLITTGQLASEVMKQLRELDDIAYLRFASSAKRFEKPADFKVEADALVLHRQIQSNFRT